MSCNIPGMREVVLYTISGIASLFILGYSIHIFIGGMVSSRTEYLAIAAAVVIGAIAMGFMAWDVMRHRR